MKKFSHNLFKVVHRLEKKELSSQPEILNEEMRGFIFSFVTAWVLFAVAGCSETSSVGGAQINKVASAVRVKTAELKTLPADEEAGDEELMFDVSVSLDSVVANENIDSTAAVKINNYIVTKMLGQSSYLSVKEAIDAFIEKKKEEFKAEEYLMTCYDHIIGTADVGLNGVINYTFHEDYYGGGAHPTQLVTIQRFDMQTGRTLGLWDVFSDSCSNTLKGLLTKKLMDREEVKTLDELHEKGFLEMVDMFLPQNFWMDKDSLSFFFNQYDIAPYALGQTSLSFSYDELKPYLKEWIKEKVEN